MALLWYLARGRAPDLKLLAPIGLVIPIFAGIIEKTRSYGAGLNLDGLEGFTVGDLFGVGFNESSVFLVTGGLIANTPEDIPYVGFAPIISSLLFPIPSELLSSKDTFEYLSDALFLYLIQKSVCRRATLCFGEYYMMFGWVSLVIAGLFLGWLLRSLWNWFSLRRGRPSPKLYSSTCCLLCVYFKGVFASGNSNFFIWFPPLFGSITAMQSHYPLV